MLIELGTDRLSNLKRRTLKTIQGTVAGILSFVGTYGMSPNIVYAEPTAQSTGISRTINPPEVKKVLDYIPTYSLDQYTQCGGEGYLDNETVLITPQEDETTLVESLGIIPGECGNPEELALQPQPTPTPEPVPTPKVEPQPTPTVLVFPRYPQIPLPSPDPSYTKRPIIKGDGECVDKTTNTLDLLREKLPTEYFLVVFHTGSIECTSGKNATFDPLANPPRVYIPKILREDRIVYAGSLAHESCHLWQFKRFIEQFPTIVPVPNYTTAGKEGEGECYNIQYQTQKKLGDHSENLRLFRESVLKDFGIIIYNP